MRGNPQVRFCRRAGEGNLPRLASVPVGEVVVMEEWPLKGLMDDDISL